MAKSIVLYGVFLGAVVCFCNYVGGVDIGNRYEQLGNRGNGVSAVRVAGDGVGSGEWSVMGGGVSTVRVAGDGVNRGERVTMGRGDEVSEVRGARYGVSEVPGAGYEVDGGEWSVMGEGVSEIRGAGYGVNRGERVTMGRGDEVSRRLEDEVRNQIKQIYSAEIGVREKTGKNDGQRVEEYLAVTQLGKGYAWCASFVSWVFAEAGFPQPRTPWSPSLFPKERVIWERGSGVRVAGFRDRDSTPTVILSETKWSRKISPLIAQTVQFAKLGFSSFHQQIYSPSLFPKERVIWERGLMRENRSFASLEDDRAANTPYLKPKTSRLIPGPPATADVFGIYFADLKRIAHVGFVDEWGDKYVITVEGVRP